MREALFVVNPAATGHFGLLRRYCQDAAVHHGWQPRFVAAQAGEHAAELNTQLSGYLGSAGEKLVVAVGGDGTVRACAQHLAGTGVALAIVPRGAANLFALALGIPAGLEPALLSGFGGEERLVDLAYADGEPFVAMAGIGIDGAVVRSTRHWLKQHLGWLGYAVAAVPHLIDPAHILTVSVDGAEPRAYNAQAVVIGNVGLLPGGFSLLPGALVDDGVLDVGVLEPKNLLGWASIARLAIAAGHSGRDPVEHQRARRVEVRCASELPRQVDGDFLGSSTSLTVRVDHRCLLVRAPQPT
jgi:diacylglycerol kinase family enzyme